MNESSEELASLYVLDQLNRDDRAAFEARLLRDPALAALVDDLSAGLETGVRALPRHEPPANLVEKIEALYETEATKARPEAALHPNTASRWNAASGRVKSPATTYLAIARWGLAAVIAVSLATLAVQSLRPAANPMIVVVGLDPNRSTFAELPLGASAQTADARFIRLASLAENFWEKPGSLPFKPAPVSGDNRGYALFDPGSRQGFIAIEQLPVVAAGQRYHLWVRDPSSARVLDAGILPLGGMNRGLYSFALGSDDSSMSARPDLFVTVEETGAAPQPAQPRGKIVLGRQRF